MWGGVPPDFCGDKNHKVPMKSLRIIFEIFFFRVVRDNVKANAPR